MSLGISMAFDRVLVPYQSSASSKNKDLAAEKILQAFSISKGEEKGNLTCFQKKWSQSYKLVFGTMGKRGRLGILSLLCPTNSVFPFVSNSELWAEFIMANRNVFSDGETGTERLEIVVETAPLAPEQTIGRAVVHERDSDYLFSRFARLQRQLILGVLLLWTTRFPVSLCIDFFIPELVGIGTLKILRSVGRHLDCN